MADKEAQIVLSLNEGVVEGVLEETANGIMTLSQNTRLTKLKGSVSRKPLVATIGTTAHNVGSMVPGGRNDVVAYAKSGNQRISETTATSVVSPVTGTAGANAYFPYPLVSSGFVGGGLVGLAPATCFDAFGNQWFVSTKIVAGTTLGTFVSVISGDGSDLITPRVIHTQTAVQFWVGVCPSPTGVVAFYEDTVGISAVALSVSGTTLTVGSPVAIYTPQEPSGYVQADLTWSSSAAYLLTRDAITNTTMRVNKVDLTSLAIVATQSRASTFSSSASSAWVSCTYVLDGANDYLAFVVSSSGGGTVAGVFSGDLSTTYWAGGVLGTLYGPVAVQPWFSGSNHWLVFATSCTGTSLDLDPTYVLFDTRAITSGASQGTLPVYWYGLQSKGCWHSPGGTDITPYFPLFGRWGAGGSPPTVAGGNPTFFFDTPSIEVVTPYSATVFTPVMRCGVDQVSQYSSLIYNSAPCATSNYGIMSIAYIADRYDQPSSANQLFAARFANFDLEPSSQCGFAVDAGPVGVVGASCPAVWDGIETTEYSPFHRPKIQVNATGGTGPALTGAIGFSAVISWRDSAGNVRKSAPALPVVVTLSGTSPVIYVTVPLTMRQGVLQELFDVSVYSTQPSGAVYIATACQGITRSSNGCWIATVVYAAVLGDIIMDEQFVGVTHLEPECPPPIWDLRAISGRIWVIDAENRYRLLPSMTKETGLAFEFNSSLEIVGFDQQYGKLVAVVDVTGSTIALAERAVWQIDGYGPDNLGQGAGFTSPRLVANIGCLSRNSVCQIPGVGVMFQEQDGRFCLMSGGFKRFETFGAYAVLSPNVHVLQNEVIYPIADGSGSVVYNWLADAWTHWTGNGQPTPASTTLQLSDRSRTYLAANNGSGSTLQFMDSISIDSSTDPIVLERGWIAPESPQGDCVVREVWFHARTSGRHSVTLTASMDYNDTDQVVQTWSADELDALTVDGRYTIALQMQKAVRAVKVNINAQPATPDETHPATVYEMCQPMSLTITYGVTAGIRNRTLLAGAKK